MGEVAEKIELVRSDIAELNEKFHDKKLLSDSFYKQLMQSGFAYRQCVLITIFPDSSNTYSGTIIKQDGSVFEFDIDLDTPEYSLFSDITDVFQKIRKERLKTKPWQKELVAFDFYQDMKGKE